MKELSLDNINNINNNENFEYFNNIYMMAQSGAKGSESQIRQLSGMRGLMSKPDNSIIETPIKSNFREGLNILEYFISTHGARKGLADTALKTANSGYLTRRLVDVSQDIVINDYNCNTLNGIKIFYNYYNKDEKNNFKNKILGRFLSNDILDSNNNIIIKKNTLINNNNYKIIKKNNYINNVSIRSPIKCDLEYGICSLCYGIDLSKNKIINIGESVGIIAAQSIGEPGTQLTMRTFHIGGATSKIYNKSNVIAKNNGILKLYNTKIINNKNNDSIIISKNSKLEILNNNNIILETYKIPYGSYLFKKNNDFINKNEIIISWDPFTVPIISEINGIIKFIDMIEGESYINKINYNTGIKYIIILDCINKNLKPSIKIVNDNNEDIFIPGTNSIYKYLLLPNSIIQIKNNSKVYIGDILSTLSLSVNKIKDITGGLPKVSDLFEARKPKNIALLAEISGFVTFGKEIKNKIKIIITDKINNIVHEEFISKYKQINVFEGEYVNKGDIISEGEESTHDILRLKGIDNVSNFIINEIQNVYKLQNVNINSKHIEIIIKQMLKKVIIKDQGDSKFIINDIVDINKIKKINKELKKNNKKEIKFEYRLMGITKSSLLTNSFISSASFQETTKILTESAILGKTDFLKGLKENIIVGNLIPAGKGYYYYNKK
ncbi:hypothetical protein [Candidatus Nardonella dryophthoridicola]|uniref:DNA-directed RNA polymerase n=1 Tax=endosymbiont of Metamasius hemipterus TaxID=204627 RepID=A0ABT0TW57_9GAMM|nr:hypothetical protein [Candidatus Nardonella dryophthoridicola]MCM0158236.1 hypothetical protein [endosymbiont of Metamasius hemipterus]